MPSRAKKATFSLNREILSALDEAVTQGAAPSKNALVERALRSELKEIERQNRRARWEEAAADPLLLADLTELEASFGPADAESAERIA